MADTANNYTAWKKRLPSELAFWRQWISEKVTPWQEDRRARLDPQTHLQGWVRERITAGPDTPIKILDVGAGPVTQLGQVWPGRNVAITAVDPLANEYNRLLDGCALTPPVRTQAGEGERLEDLFSPDSFDFACAINALDYSYDPLASIKGMLKVVKPGCWVVLMHFINGAERERYRGLRQWNFCCEDGKVVIWKRCGHGPWKQEQRIYLEDQLPLVDEFQAEVEIAEPQSALWIRLRKNGGVRTDLYLREFTPRSRLTTAVTPIEHPRFAVIDGHNHLGHLVPGVSFAGKWLARPVEELVAELDAADVCAIVDLDGGFGERLRREIARYREPYPNRFIIFAGLDYDAFPNEPDIGHYLARQLRDSAAAGAQGLKIWKLLGLQVRDQAGRLFNVNDPRLDELWATAGELKLPVLIHVADPIAFFQPRDRFNERWEELQKHPEWNYFGQDVPSFDTLLEHLREVISKHPATTFIGAHGGCYAENLSWVGQLLETCPNYYIDISGRLGELGRQPYTAHDFFTRYAQRIVFGTDAPPNRQMYQLYYRFLETRDEYFSYSLASIPEQGRWAIYGIGLSDEVLRQVYYENAARLFQLNIPDPSRKP